MQQIYASSKHPRISRKNKVQLVTFFGIPGLCLLVKSIAKMATKLDENPVKKALLKAIIKGQAEKVKEIIEKSAEISADESLDSAQNRILHKGTFINHVDKTNLNF